MTTFRSSFRNCTSENLRPTRVGDVNTERIDARLALIRWRVKHDREVPLPLICRFDRSVEIPRCFHPFDFVGTVACGQNGFHLDRDGLGYCALEGRVATIVLADERLG